MTGKSPKIIKEVRTLCLVAQLCPALCDPVDCSPPGSSVHGDSPVKNTGVGGHTRLQWIFPTQGSNPGLPHCRQVLNYLSHQGSPRILAWVAYPFSRGIFTTQQSNQGLPDLQADSLSAELKARCFWILHLNSVSCFLTYLHTWTLVLVQNPGSGNILPGFHSWLP